MRELEEASNPIPNPNPNPNPNPHPHPNQASNDGSAFVDVLQRLYPDEWLNFVERLGLADLPKARYTEDAALGMQVQRWA